MPLVIYDLGGTHTHTHTHTSGQNDFLETPAKGQCMPGLITDHLLVTEP